MKLLGLVFMMMTLTLSSSPSAFATSSADCASPPSDWSPKTTPLLTATSLEPQIEATIQDILNEIDSCFQFQYCFNDSVLMDCNWQEVDPSLCHSAITIGRGERADYVSISQKSICAELFKKPPGGIEIFLNLTAAGPQPGMKGGGQLENGEAECPKDATTYASGCIRNGAGFAWYLGATRETRNECESRSAIIEPHYFQLLVHVMEYPMFVESDFALQFDQTLCAHSEISGGHAIYTVPGSDGLCTFPGQIGTLWTGHYVEKDAWFCLYNEPFGQGESDQLTGTIIASGTTGHTNWIGSNTCSWSAAPGSCSTADMWGIHEHAHFDTDDGESHTYRINVTEDNPPLLHDAITVTSYATITYHITWGGDAAS